MTSRRRSSIDVTLGELAATLVLVALAVAVSFWQRADLERDIGIAVLRSFMQLTAIGFVINAIFEQDNLLFVFALIAVMVRVRRLHGARPRAIGPGLVRAAADRRSRSPPSPRSGWWCCSGCSSPSRASWCRSGGMVVGNAMTAAAVSLNRLGDEVRSGAGADRGDAGARRDRDPGDGADAAPQPALGDDPADRLDQDDRADLLPGHDGRACCWPAPTRSDAVRLQLILLCALLGSVSLSALTATGLAYRNFFTPAHSSATYRQID